MSARDVSPPETGDLTWTELPDKSGVIMTSHSGSWLRVTERLGTVGQFPSKDKCPWIKMATFGDKRTDKGSLRHNANVLAITGIEGDYDGEKVTMVAAQEMLERHGIKGVLYPSPSSTPEKPRWRAICPSSKPHLPEERSRFVARLNGALGGILAPESFTLSQGYFFGATPTNNYYVQITFGDPDDGQYIDKLDQLDKIAIGKSRIETKEHTPVVLDAIVPDETIEDLRDALKFMPSDDRGQWVRMGHALKTLGDAGYPLWIEWSEKSSKFDAQDAENKWEGFDPIATGFQAVFSEAQRQGWQNPRLHIDSAADPCDFQDEIESESRSERKKPVGGDPDPVAVLEQNIIALSANDSPFDVLPHYVERWIPQNEVTLLAGHGGSGKSYVALSIAVHVALGLTFGSLATIRSNVLFFSGEDGARVLQQRLAKLCRALEIDLAQLEGKLHLLDASDIDPALHRERRDVVAGRPVIVTKTPLLDGLATLVEKLQVGLIVIDNASDTYDDDEIKRVRVRAFVRSLRSNIARPNRAVLLLAHVNKASANAGRNAGTEDYSGSTAWHNSVRSRLSLTTNKDDVLTVEHAKANLGEKAAPVKLIWQEGVPMLDRSYSGTDAGLAAVRAEEKARDDKDKSALVELIQGFDRRGERVTTSAQGSATVFKLLKGQPEFPKNTDSTRLMLLLRQLETECVIYRREVKTPDRKTREVFTCIRAPESAPISKLEPLPATCAQEVACAN